MLPRSFSCFFNNHRAALLTVLCFDHYGATFHPLHYEVIVNRDACVQSTTVSWPGGDMSAVMHTAGTFSLSYRGSNIFHKCFCDILQLLAISCSENWIREIFPILIRVVLSICCFIFIIASYICIFSTVRKIDQCLLHFFCISLWLSVFVGLRNSFSVNSVWPSALFLWCCSILNFQSPLHIKEMKP